MSLSHKEAQEKKLRDQLMSCTTYLSSAPVLFLAPLFLSFSNTSNSQTGVPHRQFGKLSMVTEPNNLFPVDL